MRRARLAALPVALPVAWVVVATALLAGCGTPSPQARLNSALNTVLAEANSGDPDGLRSALEAFVAEVEALGRSGKIPSSQVTRLRDFAKAAFDDADLIDRDVQESLASASAAASSSAAAKAEASRSAAAASASAAAASASAAAAASAEASRSAAAASASAASASASAEPTETDPAIIPTTGAGAGVGRQPDPSPTPTP